MLILERHSGESIQINDDIKLTIYYNKGNQIKMGVNAPRSVSIMREELCDTNNNRKKMDENSDKSPTETATPEKNQSSVTITTKRKKRLIMPEPGTLSE